MRRSTWLWVGAMSSLIFVACDENIEPADNSRCHVCHINFEDEEMSVVHAKAGVSCEKCHGESDDHCGDEGNITPPGVIYAKSDIDSACGEECHAEQLEPHDVIGDNPEAETCSDCHGKHKMEHRNTRWDKKTRKLIPAE